MGKGVDLTRKVINSLTVLGLSHNNGRNYWRVQCHCGQEKPRPLLSAEINRHKGLCMCASNVANTSQGKFLVGDELLSSKKGRYFKVICTGCASLHTASTYQITSGVDFCGCQSHTLVNKGQYTEVTVAGEFSFILDTEDYYKHVRNRRWHLTNSKTNKHRYVATSNTEGLYPTLLHRLILGTREGLVTDHINGITTDNRKINLREVTNTINCRNCAISESNTSGCTGVKALDNGFWWAYIMVDRKQISLGRKYLSMEDAITARKEAEAKYGFHENHGRNNHNNLK